MPRGEPAYIDRHRSGELAEKAALLLGRLASCDLCPRRCRVDRLKGETGFCRTGRLAVVSSGGAHFGEEDPLVGRGGSGTIFFTHCNLGCCFCQNYEISHLGEGREVGPQGLARMMLALQEQGCHNINFVSPSHVLAQILEALPPAIDSGLRIPLVFNTGGYDLAESIRLLDGVFDIYMPDCKFSGPEVAAELAGARDYPVVVREALREMHRQVGDLRLDGQGVALRGLLVRHLVLPNGLAGTDACLAWVAEHLSPNTYLNIMDQYRPCGTAAAHPLLNRRITPEEYRRARECAASHGLARLDGVRKGIEPSR